MWWCMVRTNQFIGLSLAIWLGISANMAIADPKPVLTLGYSAPDDGSPVSQENRKVTGFCGALFDFLQSDNDLKLKYDFSFYRIDQVNKRFGEFAKILKPRQPGVQCGPSSSNFSRQQELNTNNGQFSEIFFTSQTKVLIRKDSISRLYAQSAKNPIQIGLLNPPPLNSDNKKPSPSAAYLQSPSLTTTSVSSLFPHAEIVPLPNRDEIVQQLASGKLVAYASDGLILEDILRNSLGDKRDQFSIEPPLGSFLREDYVLVVYNNSTQELDIVNKINNWLKSSEGLNARQVLEQAREGDSFTQTLEDGLIWLNRGDHLASVRWWLNLALISFALILLGLSFWLTRRLKRTKQLLVTAKTNTAANSISVDKQTLLNYSQELHDDVCQMMVAAKRFVEGITLSPENQQAQAQKTLSLTTIDEISQKIRTLSHTIHRQALDGLDELLIDFTKRTQINTTRTGELRWNQLPENLQRHLSLIIREALTNIERHAQAKQVQVDLSKTATGLSLVIYDDGLGNPKTQPSGIGLTNIRNRVEHDLKGQVHIALSAGQGTTLRIDIPFNE